MGPGRRPCVARALPSLGGLQGMAGRVPAGSGHLGGCAMRWVLQEPPSLLASCAGGGGGCASARSQRRCQPPQLAFSDGVVEWFEPRRCELRCGESVRNGLFFPTCVELCN